MCGVAFRILCSSLETQFVPAILGIPCFGLLQNMLFCERHDPENFSLSVFSFHFPLLKGQSHLCSAVCAIGGEMEPSHMLVPPGTAILLK